MALGHSPKIVTDGLVFYYDVANTVKSWKGAPTTNYAYLQNPRIDSSYSSYTATSTGTWVARHSDAIRVYASDNSEITGYVNTGVTDWANTHHAIWTYDTELCKPVVTMRDYDGQWKAKSFVLSVSAPAGMGLTNGSSYTISWLSWTDDITKCANAGMYSRKTADGTYNFWDGQSNSYGTAFNTQARTWQRVYATFTVNAVVDTASTWSCYMYGHYGNRGTVKIADVQIEPLGYPTGFYNGLTRSNTQSMIDLTGNNTITVSNLSYSSNGSVSFSESASSTLTTNNLPVSSLSALSGHTYEAWVKCTAYPTVSVANGYGVTYKSGVLVGAAYYSGSALYWYGNSSGNVCTIYGYVRGNDAYITTTGYNLSLNTYYHLVTTHSENPKKLRLYVNGVLYSEVAGATAEYNSSNIATAGNVGVNKPQIDGGGTANYSYFNGSVDSVKVYNRGLTANEVQINFNASRGKYGI